MLYVVNHGSTQNMRDNDNIEVKTFIDAAIKGEEGYLMPGGTE